MKHFSSNLKRITNYASREKDSFVVDVTLNYKLGTFYQKLIQENFMIKI